MDIQLKRRHRIQIGNPGGFNITLVGCGGTGSFLAPHLARLAYHAAQRYGTVIQLRFIDPDQVEPKNIGRQNFCPAEIGANKARALATRYNLAFGLDIEFDSQPIDVASILYGYSWFNLVVGAVDNAAARQEICEDVIAASGKMWWLDCGNHEQSSPHTWG